MVKAMNKKSVEIKKNVINFLNFLMIGYAVVYFYRLIVKSAYCNLIDVHSWGVSEFLINYQGGYVRRGLLGEVLLQISNTCFLLDPRWLIALISFGSLFYVLYFIVRKFYEKKFCWWLLPLNICLSGGFIIRKDYICMAIVIAMFSAFFCLRDWRSRLFFSLLSILLALNIHECYFFICAPFMMLLYITEQSLHKVYKWLSVLAILMMMAVVCLNKGDMFVASKIYQSWNHIFPAYQGDIPRNSIHAIGWETWDTIKHHIYRNFLLKSSFVFGWYSKPIVWIIILFIFPNVLFVGSKLSGYSMAKYRHCLLSVMVFQFVSLLPMFTILSCDPARICFYWTVSSLIILLCVPIDKIMKVFPKFYSEFIAKLLRVFVFRKSQVIAVSLMLIIGVSYNGTYIYSAIGSSVIGTYVTYVKIIHNVITLAL